MFSGFLNLWKPEGVRSSWCVHEVKKLLPRGVKIGHGGTLDSTAEGVLVLLVGKATRLSRYVMALPKTYVVRLQFGIETDTLDASGKIVQKKPFEFVDEAMIDVELCRFLGPIMQRPPAVSAIRVQGKRSHSLARNGAAVCHRERAVFVRSIRRLTNIGENGEVTLEIVCGKGTYVRSIVRDLGRNLGACAVTVRLCRMDLGPYSRVMACDLAAITENNDISKLVAPVDCLLGSYTTYQLDELQEKTVSNGQPVLIEKLQRLRWGEIQPGRVVFLRSRRLLSAARPMIRSGAVFAFPETTITTGQAQ